MVASRTKPVVVLKRSLCDNTRRDQTRGLDGVEPQDLFP